MSLSNATLAAIQHAGTAIFAADVELKTTVKQYSDRVNEAMLSNPFGVGNDALFENWKIVARLSQTMTGIEAELKNIFRVASDLAADDQPSEKNVLAIAAPEPLGEGEASRSDVTPTDVVVKIKKKTLKSGPRVTKKSQRTAKSSGTSADQSALGGNAVKLLRHFEHVLNTNQFTNIQQSAIANEIGIPLGSMTAAIKKLLTTGWIIAGPTGGLILANIAQPMGD